MGGKLSDSIRNITKDPVTLAIWTFNIIAMMFLAFFLFFGGRWSVPYALAFDSRTELGNTVLQTRTVTDEEGEYLPSIVESATYEGDECISRRELIEEKMRGTIPEYLNDFIVSRGWNMCFVDGCPTNPIQEFLADMEGVTIAGVSKPAVKTIVISIPRTDAIGKTEREVILHEIGHAVDIELGWISHEGAFQQCLDEIDPACGIGVAAAHRSALEEKYADMFAWYWLYPDDARYAPALYDWLERTIGPSSRDVSMLLEEMSHTVHEHE